ncbi:LysR family transcriptional regulator [Azohydromonas lata]|uniref:LysR family transcriptional regulator n=1 Tax=Azohydromonas lata TaxID=45677 RepID=A0ABU5IEG2_9BURK|nr:LysR family transcriptional regulator [Azohydromonas lata]MDZ5457514.1 LysR family transcriptional regulator [Azohydromonas lata]
MSTSETTPSPALPAASALDRLALMATFVRIVEAGSLSAAAAQLGTTQPTVSRRLQALERSLGLRLIQRSTHAMQLTEDGQRCLERAKALLSDWEAFESDLRGRGEVAEGRLRVVVPHAMGQHHLMAPLAEFLHAHPRVDIEWLLHDDAHGLIAQGVDCAIQVGEVTDTSLVAIRLSSVERILVAAPQVLAGARAPSDPQDLAGLPWLALRTYYRADIELYHRDGRQSRHLALRPRLSTDSLYALRSAALQGLGVAAVSAWSVTEDIAQGRLLHVAPDWVAPPLPVFLLYPPAPHYPARLRRFVEVFRRAMPPTLAG